MQNLIRIFIPSWRFFDRIGAHPRVLAQFASDPSPDAWRPLFTPPRPSWWRVLFNPAGTLHHANMNLVQRLLEEAMADDVDLIHLPSYLVLAQIARARGATRFKLVARDQDVFTSPEVSA